MIAFDNWEISSDGEIIARQGDNLTRRIDVVGDLPDGWEWELLVEQDGLAASIEMIPIDGGVGAVLQSGQLEKDDCTYNVQLRGTSGDLVRHTNIIPIYIPRSIVPQAHWPTIPSEFTQFESRIMKAVTRAEAAADRAEAAVGGGSA